LDKIERSSFTFKGKINRRRDEKPRGLGDTFTAREQAQKGVEKGGESKRSWEWSRKKEKTTNQVPEKKGGREGGVDRGGPL